MREYVFTYATWAGPCVVRFERAGDMLAYLSGYTEDGRQLVAIVSPTEIRA